MNKKIAYIMLLIIAICYFNYNNDSSILVAVDDEDIIDEIEEANETTLNEDTESETDNIDIGKNFIVFNVPNIVIQNINITYITDLLGIDNTNSMKLLNYDNKEVSCKGKKDCYFGTGMKIVLKEDEATDDASESEEEASVEDFSDILPYNEVDASESDYDIDNNVITSNDSGEKYIAYYIIVVGDVTGDGQVEINDIVKSKNSSLLEANNNVTEGNIVSLSDLYKRALSLYDSKSQKYLKIETNDLALFKTANTSFLKKLESEEDITIENKKIVMGISDIFKIKINSNTKGMINYKIQDSSIAIVNEEGIITARKQGKTKIEVSSGSKTELIDLEVLNAPRRIVFSEQSVNMLIGDKHTNKVTIQPFDAKDSEISYKSSDTSIAVVDEDGTVTAIAAGKTTITGTTVNGKTASYDVLVTKERNINMSAINVTDKKGTIKMTDSVNNNDSTIDGELIVEGSFTLNATATYENGEKAPINWKSSNESIANISSDGVVSPIKAGIVNLYAISGSNTKSYTIKIYSVSSGNNENLNIDVGKSSVITYNLKDSNGTIVSVEDMGLSIKGNDSNYISTKINNNKVTFTGEKETTEPLNIEVYLNDIIIGRFNIDINDTSITGKNTVAFLPINYSGTGDSEAVLLKSSDGKLALIDTAINKGSICSQLVKYIHRYAGVSDTAVAHLDYLILSHSHTDHVGCVNYFLENANNQLSIGTIVVKNESLSAAYYGYKNVYNYIKAKKNSNTSLIETSDKSENYTLALGEGTRQMKLHLFNVSDIYKGVSKCLTSDGKVAKSYGAVGGIARYTSAGTSNTTIISIKGTKDGKTTTSYPYIKYADDDEVKYAQSNAHKNLKDNRSNSIGKEAPAFFYFYRKAALERCSANANSIAVLAEVPINGDSRYIYIPSDIENNGYSLTGEVKVVDGVNVRLTGAGNNYFYKCKTKNTTTKKCTTYQVSDNKLVENTGAIVRKAREYKTALTISKTIDKNKIIIYQAAHHGINNDKASIDILNLNRNNLYVVSPSQNNIKDDVKFRRVRTYWYNLHNATTAYNKYYWTGNYSNASGTGTLQFDIDYNGIVNVITNK